MQNIGNLAFLNSDGIVRYLGAQAGAERHHRIPDDNESAEEAHEPHEWIERRMRDRRHKPV